MFTELKSKIQDFLDTQIEDRDRFFGGESILKNRDKYEEFIHNEIMKDVDNLDDKSKFDLFTFIVQSGVVLPIPYTTSNFKKIHYFANEVFNLANIFYEDNGKDIEFSFPSNTDIIRDIAMYIRSNNDEGAFVYRSSLFELPDNGIIHTEITKLDGLRGIFTSEYITINVSPKSVDFTVKRVPLIERDLVGNSKQNPVF